MAIRKVSSKKIQRKPLSQADLDFMAKAWAESQCHSYEADAALFDQRFKGLLLEHPRAYVVVYGGEIRAICASHEAAVVEIGAQDLPPGYTFVGYLDDGTDEFSHIHSE